MIICIDFDGTCVFHAYPDVGADVPGAEQALADLVMAGHKLVLFTMRSGEPLADAVAWFKTRALPLYGVNKNPKQHKWTSSPKAYGQLYIDDAALGAPLLYDPALSDRPFLDWPAARKLLFP